jgi:hypothetical protein
MVAQAAEEVHANITKVNLVVVNYISIYLSLVWHNLYIYKLILKMDNYCYVG